MDEMSLITREDENPLRAFSLRVISTKYYFNVELFKCVFHILKL